MKGLLLVVGSSLFGCQKAFQTTVYFDFYMVLTALTFPLWKNNWTENSYSGAHVYDFIKRLYEIIG